MLRGRWNTEREWRMCYVGDRTLKEERRICNVGDRTMKEEWRMCYVGDRTQKGSGECVTWEIEQ